MNKIDTAGAILCVYADDIALWRTYQGRFQNVASRPGRRWHASYQRSVDNLITYLTHNGFSLSPDKCQMLVFGRQDIGKGRENFSISLGQATLRPQKEAKFLGVFFTQTFTWKRHIDHVITKAKRKFSLLRVLSREKWATGGRTLINIAMALVRSILIYGSECYHGAGANQMRRLVSTDVSALRIALGLPRSSHILRTYKESGVLPFDSLVRLNAAKYICRGRQIDNSIGGELLEPSRLTYSDRAASDFQSTYDFAKPLLESDEIDFLTIARVKRSPVPPWILHGAQYVYDYTDSTKGDEPQLVSLAARELLNTRFGEHFRVFTDGSRITFDRVGAAFYVPELGIARRYGLLPGNSVYTAELVALCMVLGFLSELRPLPTRICLATDSRASLVALENPNSKERSTILHEIRILISNMILRGSDVALLWVPSHTGIRGNDRVDREAHTAALGIETDPQLDVGLTPGECKTLLDERAWERWARLFAEEAAGVNFPLKSPPEKKCRFPFNGHAAALFHRIRTNAWKYKYVQGLPLCLCGAPISPAHMLLECPRRQGETDLVLTLLRDLDLPRDISSLLEHNKKCGWNIALLTLNILYRDPQGYLL
jgi:ribonuclease HI